MAPAHRARRGVPRARVRLVGWLSIAALVVLAVGGPAGSPTATAWAPAVASAPDAASRPVVDPRASAAQPARAAAPVTPDARPTAARAATPRPAGARVAAPRGVAAVRAAAARPGSVGRADRARVTPPPTALLPADGGPSDADAWRVAMLALAATLAVTLLVSPATSTARR